MELLSVLRVIDGYITNLTNIDQLLSSDFCRLPPAVDDVLGMQPVLNQLLGFPQQLAGQNRHSGGAVPDLVVLSLRNLNQDPGRRVVDVHRLQNSGPVVRHRDVVHLRPRTHRLQDLVHALRPHGRLDQVAHGDRPNEVSDLSHFALQLHGVLLQHGREGILKIYLDTPTISI